jgi:transposase-like protein
MARPDTPKVLDRLVTEMYARGLSTQDVEDAFRDATGQLSAGLTPVEMA